jgi:hypothetical protein
MRGRIGPAMRAGGGAVALGLLLRPLRLTARGLFMLLAAAVAFGLVAAFGIVALLTPEGGQG